MSKRKIEMCRYHLVEGECPKQKGGKCPKNTNSVCQIIPTPKPSREAVLERSLEMACKIVNCNSCVFYAKCIRLKMKCGDILKTHFIRKAQQATKGGL